ncbi:solute carrier family 41 [Culex quinquefasciatus]|uniref:Solute carrier family 41 n=1 Tax=Culex quinquefasciatus TaxID=7176 RepID=B0WND5_CULQU|nr:solute carrier family 41 [Culex quinquefasciatus]|eukprot:XP_001850219.1 solute carrier family 41 [Culex quinquefasciatus]
MKVLKIQWKVFEHVTELFILVPALLGLKGNLDMCLASRLSTQANLGNMVGVGEITHMVLGNIALVQVQATVAAFLVSLFAIGVGAAINGLFLIDHALLLTASAMFTANLSCFVLDFVIVAVILLSNRLKLNPDNLATPMAASIGDMNRYTRPVLKSGWIPVLSALFISSLGGLVLNAAVGMFSGFVVFQPIINGIGGNLVSVQASKLSTMLHQSTTFGTVPSFTKIFEKPWKALFKGAPSAKTSRILILMSIPGQVLFIFLADLIHMSESTIGAPFVFSYLLASLIQVMLLLYIAHVIIHAMWKWKIDPDSAAIPYLTALGDLFGTSLLLVAFIFIEAVGHPYDYPIANYVHNFF